MSGQYAARAPPRPADADARRPVAYGDGVFAYLTSPLWLALLVLSTFDAVQRALASTEYFKPGFNLFPNWPVATDFQIHLLLGMTLAALFLPKLLGLVLVLFSRSERRAFGGAWRLCASVLVEVLFSALLAPVMMLFQTLSVGLTLLGRSVAWEAQPRGDRGVDWREALLRLGWHTLVGAAWAGGVYAVTPDFFWWLTPIWLGLVLSLPLSVWSSRRSLGLALKRIGLFLTPEETRPPPELSRLRQALQSELNFAGLVPVANAEALVPPEAGVAMPRFLWPQGTPAMVQEIQYSATESLLTAGLGSGRDDWSDPPPGVGWHCGERRRGPRRRRLGRWRFATRRAGGLLL